jgi:putative sigma-54 modulation protein
MNLEVTVRHIELSDNVKNYATQEVEGLTQYWDNIPYGQIVFDKEHVDFDVEIVIRVSGKTLTASDTADDVIKAVDGAVDKLRRQLKKYKGKMINH